MHGKLENLCATSRFVNIGDIHCFSWPSEAWKWQRKKWLTLQVRSYRSGYPWLGMTNFFESDRWWPRVSKTLEYNNISRSPTSFADLFLIKDGPSPYSLRIPRWFLKLLFLCGSSWPMELRWLLHLWYNLLYLSNFGCELQSIFSLVPGLQETTWCWRKG